MIKRRSANDLRAITAALGDPTDSLAAAVGGCDVWLRRRGGRVTDLAVVAACAVPTEGDYFASEHASLQDVVDKLLPHCTPTLAEAGAAVIYAMTRRDAPRPSHGAARAPI